jgi:hypothetical protein
MKATGWDTGLCQDYDKGLAKWFSSRLSAKNDFLKGQGMIRIPPQHNTQNTPGQIVNPVGVASPTKQIKDLASEISDFHLNVPKPEQKKD